MTLIQSVALSAVLLIAGGAHAAPPMRPHPTVQQFLETCSKPDAVSQSDCDTPIHVNIMTMGMVPQSAICLPKDGDFPKLRAAIVQWLGAHAELQAKKTMTESKRL